MGAEIVVEDGMRAGHSPEAGRMSEHLSSAT